MNKKQSKNTFNLMILGYPRGGTTLLGKLLNSNPQINLTTESRVAFLCLYVLRHLEAISTRNVEWKNNNFFIRSQYYRRARKILEKHLKNAMNEFHRGAKWNGDKFPDYLWLIDEIKRTLPDIKKIWCVRNPYDTLASWRKMPGGENRSIVEMTRSYNRIAEIIKGNFAEGDIMVHCEDLFANPPKVLGDLATILEVPNDFNLAIFDKRPPKTLNEFEFQHIREYARKDFDRPFQSKIVKVKHTIPQ